MFPSPTRGLFFITLTYNDDNLPQDTFPSPTRGLFFIEKILLIEKEVTLGFRPLLGAYFLFEKLFNLATEGFLRFPSPTRGLFFITSKRSRCYEKDFSGFRPLLGAYFLLICFHCLNVNFMVLGFRPLLGAYFLFLSL